MTSVLIGETSLNITYDRRTGRYRSADGRFVKRAEILRLVDQEAMRLEVRLKGHARNLISNRIDLPEFQRRMSEDLKLSAIRSTLLASGGKAQTTQAAYGVAGRELRSQYEFLQGFSQDLAAGKLTPTQAIARAGLYGVSVRTTFHSSEKITKGREGFRLAKRVLDAGVRHCSDCLRHATPDFIPIDQIVAVGTRCRCRSRCRCKIIYKK